MNIIKLAAFSDGSVGGNPAGIVIEEKMPRAMMMRQIASEVGFSETAFAVPQGDGWRVRYFSPESEVPFCGHATIALGAALAKIHGAGTFPLQLKASDISVSGEPVADSDLYTASLTSPPTTSGLVSPELRQQALALFGLTSSDLDERVQPALMDAGSNELLLALHNRDTLAAMHYDLNQGKTLMHEAGLVGIHLIHIDEAGVVHARNAFASGGVLEDPATGAAAAALGGYLRDQNYPGYLNGIDIIQGEDMGMRSLLRVELSDQAGSPVKVSGTVREL